MTFVMRSLDIALRILDRVLKNLLKLMHCVRLILLSWGEMLKLLIWECIIISSKDNHLKP